MEAISDGQITQDSCLHAGGSLAALLMTGNGMYRRWQTTDALIQVPISSSYGNDDGNNNGGGDDDDDGNSYGSGYTMVYDYGACSVHQLISGYGRQRPARGKPGCVVSGRGIRGFQEAPCQSPCSKLVRCEESVRIWSCSIENIPAPFDYTLKP